MDPLQRVFANLDAWRHLPTYQLERRADIFFSTYLPEVIEKKTGAAVEPLVPELPLKCALLWPTRKAGNQSVKVDYFTLARDRSRAFLVELKTDLASRREEQDEDLRRAKALGLPALLQGIKEIMLATEAHEKYFHLAERLQHLGLLALPNGLETLVFSPMRHGLRAQLEKIQVIAPAIPIEILYVQPKGDGDVIDFAFFERSIAGYDDAFSALFREYLRRWIEPAGRRQAQRGRA
jgi:hypothetical protein